MFYFCCGLVCCCFVLFFVGFFCSLVLWNFSYFGRQGEGIWRKNLKPLLLPHDPNDLSPWTFLASDIPSSMAHSYCYINQSRCFIIQGLKRNWTCLHFLHFISDKETNNLERTLLLTIKLIHLILVYWKKNNLAEKIGLLLIKANICPGDPLCQDKRIGCLVQRVFI